MERGKTAESVSAAVRERREELHLSQQALADRLGALGRPMQVTAVSKIEAGDRRVDVDDLVALASALEVSPSQLLSADTEDVKSRAFLAHDEALQPVLDAARGARDATGLSIRQIGDYLRFVGPFSEGIEAYMAEKTTKGARRGKR